MFRMIVRMPSSNYSTGPLCKLATGGVCNSSGGFLAFVFNSYLFSFELDSEMKILFGSIAHHYIIVWRTRNTTESVQEDNNWRIVIVIYET